MPVEEVFEGQAQDISRCDVLIVNVLLVTQQKACMFSLHTKSNVG